MNLASRINTTPRNVGKFLVIYGPCGVGKTTTVAQADNSIVLQARDRSLDVLMSSGVLPEIPNINLDNWQDTLEVLDALASQSDIRVVILDGISGLEQFCDDETVIKDFSKSMSKFLAFGNGYKQSAARWIDLLNRIDRCKESGITVILLGHKGLTEIKNADGANYMKFMPLMHGLKFNSTSQYCDAVLRMDYAVEICDVNEQTGKGKAKGSSRRFMYCEGEASYEAKNRLNLPALIDLGTSHVDGWNNFTAALIAGKDAQ